MLPGRREAWGDVASVRGWNHHPTTLGQVAGTPSACSLLQGGPPGSSGGLVRAVGAPVARKSFSGMEEEREAGHSYVKKTAPKAETIPFFFCFLGLYLQYMEVPRIGAESELQLLANATATARQDLSRI